MIMRSKIIISIAFLCMLFLTGSASAAVDFPADEAGISAYVKASPSIDINDTKSAFASIECETADYIIGTVEMWGHTEEQQPHIYVSKDGWIVAYYPNNRPSSWIIPWYSYNTIPNGNSTLSDAVNILVNKVGGSNAGLKYYNFNFPDATKIMLIAESTTSSNYFNVTVPNSFSLYEAGWSHYSPYIHSVGSTNLDGETFSSGANLKYGIFDTLTEFSKGNEHSIAVSSSGESVFVGLVLVYAE